MPSVLSLVASLGVIAAVMYGGCGRHVVNVEFYVVNGYSFSPAERDAIALAARRAGLRLNERQFELLCAAAPYVEQMAGRLRRPRAFTEEPASLFRFGPR